MKATPSSNSLWKGALLALLLACAAVPAQADDDWALKDKDGVNFRLSSLKGKWVLVNFWAPWCPPCLEEMPELNSLHKKHHNLQVIGVAVMYKNKQEVLNIIKARGVSYPIVMGSEDIASDFGEIHGLPTSFLYTPTGHLAGRHEGPLTQGEIESAIQQKTKSTSAVFH